MKHLAIAGLILAMAASGASAQINAGEQKPEPSLPFNMVQVTTLNLPWKIAFLPDGRMLITEKVAVYSWSPSKEQRRPLRTRQPLSGEVRVECWACISLRTIRRTIIFTSPILSRVTEVRAWRLRGPSCRLARMRRALRASR